MRIIALTAMVLFLCACQKNDPATQQESFYHLSIDGTSLPVLLRGNVDSKQIMVFINGGPGLSSLDLAEADLFSWRDNLEKSITIAYYDQRGCGNAQGDFNESSINLGQYRKDLHQILILLKAQYPDAQISLCGHSFGGFLASSYLINYGQKALADKLILIDGALNYDFELSWEFRHTFLKEMANNQISLGHNIEHWQDALDWSLENPILISDLQKNTWRKYVGQPGEFLIPDESLALSFRDYLKLGFNSSYNPFPSYFSSNLEKVNKLLNKELEGRNLQAYLKSINNPTLFLWGQYDDLIPPQEGLSMFDSLGTDPIHKEFIEIPDAGHEPMFSQGSVIQNSIRRFIFRP